MTEIQEGQKLQPFGYKMTWLAIRGADATVVADYLDFQGRRAASWNEGIEAAYQGFGGGALFISPPIGVWTLVLGYDTAFDLGASAREEKAGSALRALSKRFGEVQWFATHRVVEAHGWAKFVGGKTARAYHYIGEQGEAVRDEGPATPEEIALELAFDLDNKFPDEENVLDIAAAWGMDPKLRNAPQITGTGILGSMGPRAEAAPRERGFWNKLFRRK